MSTDPKPAAHYPPARAAVARLALIGSAFSAFALLGCFNFGYDDSGLPPPLTLTAMRPTFDAMLTAEAHATAQARGTAFAQSPIRPLGPPLTVPNASLQLRELAFSPDGTVLASINTNSILLWDIETREPIGSPLAEPEGRRLWNVSFSPDGKRVAAGSCGERAPQGSGRACAGGRISIWDLSTGQKWALSGHADEVTRVEFSPDSTHSRLASASADGTILLWDVARGEPLGPPLTHEAGVFQLAFSPDGRLLAAAGQGFVVLWDISAPQSPRSIPIAGGDLSPSDIAFSPDGGVLVWVEVNTLTFWQVSTRPHSSDETLFGNMAYDSLVFSPDGRLMASGSDEGAVVLWDSASRERVEVYLDPATSQLSIYHLAFSPDGKTLAVLNNPGTITLLDITPAYSTVFFADATPTPPALFETNAGTITPVPCDGEQAAFPAGVADNFDPANGVEPSQPGDLLRALIENGHTDPLLFEGLDQASRAVRDFDEAGSDQWFGHTFANLHAAGSRICAATLEIRAETGKGGTLDLLFLTDYFPDTDMAGYEYGWSNAWDGVSEPGGVARLNLDALPLMGGAVTVLNSLNDYSYLDVVIHDDLAVDHMILTLRYAIEPAAPPATAP